MGKVYRAEDTRLGRQVALKLLSSEVAGDRDRLDRFRREARAVASLNHPNVVTLYSVEEADGHHFLTMELVEGTTLAASIVEQGLPTEQVVGFGIRIADALAAAHDRNILHRDLKPANIMVNGEGRVKVLDFGLAKILEGSERRQDSSEIQTRLKTQDGMLLGTLPYMSPEQVRGKSHDPRSDLFSLGVILYELASGNPPFASDSTAELISSILRDAPEPFASPDEPLAYSLWKVVERCLTRDLDGRYPNARALRADLEEVAERPSTGAFPLLSPRGEKGRAQAPSSGLRRVFQTCLCFGQAIDVGLSPGLQLADGERSRYLSGETLPKGLLDCLVLHGGIYHEVSADVASHTGLACLATFDVPADAVSFALDLQAMDDLDRPGIGIQLGDIVVDGERIRGQAGESPTLAATARLAALAKPGQVLLGRMAFDSARREVTDSDSDRTVAWRAHGMYSCSGLEEPIEVFEVGIESVAPLEPPVDSEVAKRQVDSDAEEVLGWRPAAGLEVPLRPGWILRQQLGSGGFGEVWRARHRGLATERVFKFCFEPDQLRALKREVALFRLLHRSLGGRRDIARLLDWQVDEQPYFLESEYHGDGNLRQWANAQGGLEAIDLEVRLEIVAQVAEALAAAHGVGVLHKDVKPSNVLVGNQDGHPRVWLADFGIGVVTNRELLAESGVTEIGLTETLSSTHSETGGGTRLYMAPELSVGGTATLRSDIYSLGVLLYQVVVGDLERVLGHGWQREIADVELQEDIAACVDVDPEQRLADAGELARRLRARGQRRAAREAEAKRELERIEAEALRLQRRRRRERRAYWTAMSLALASLLAGAFIWREARAFRTIVDRSTTTILEQVLETNRLASYWVAQALNRELAAAALVAERLAADPEVRAALRQGDLEKGEAILESRRRDFGMLPMRGVSIFEADGTMLARAPAMPELYGRNFAFRDYFSAGDPDQQPIRETYISEPFVTQAADRATLLAIAAPVWPADRVREGPTDAQPVGVVSLSLTLDHLSRWVGGARNEEGSAAATDMDVVILNERGQLVVHPENPLRIGTSPTPASWPEAVALFEGESAALQLADPMLGGQEAYPTGLTRVPRFGWLVMVRSLEVDRHPAASLISSVAQVNRASLMATGFLVVLLLLVGIFITTQALRSRRSAKAEATQNSS